MKTNNQSQDIKERKIENPFFHNYVFSRADLDRARIQKPWWEWPWLFFLPTYVQISDGFAVFYKQYGNQYFITGFEKL